MEKTRIKITIWRALQIAFYCLGFPMAWHKINAASSALGGSYTTAAVADKAVNTFIVLWVIVIVVQILLRVFLRKDRALRAVIGILAAVIVCVSPILNCDLTLRGNFEEDAAAYAEKGVGIDRFDKQLMNYASIASGSQSELNEFINVFNIRHYSKDYNAGGKNTDLSPVTYNAEDDAFYSLNGMYSDGYVFGYKQARKVLTDYYTIKAAYEAEGKNVDVALQEAILALETDANSNWNKYKAGSDLGDGYSYITAATEYKDAYGITTVEVPIDENNPALGKKSVITDVGTARKFYLTPERIDAILGVLGAKLAANSSISSLLNAAGSMLDDPAITALIDTVKANLNGELNMAKLLEIVNGLNLPIGETTINAQMLVQLIDPSSEATEVTEAMIMSLLSGFSSYQSPTTYPVYHFIADEQLKTYAYANYYATVHGAKVGSVLVGKVNDNGQEMVGLINLDSNGTVNPYTPDSLAALFARLDVAEEYQHEYYPAMILRNVLQGMFAIIIITMIGFYLFSELLDKEYAKLTLKQGGNE